jgi:hypothetical protein
LAKSTAPSKQASKRSPTPIKEVKEESHPPASGKDEKEGVKDEIVTVISDDEEKDLGDDSNAPNPGVKEEAKHEDRVEEERTPTKETPRGELEQPSSNAKRKRDAVDTPPPEEDKSVRKGGHQTRVVRRTEDDKGKDVSARLWNGNRTG